MIKDFPKKRRGYYYIKEGDVETAYVSVTTVLGILAKPALVPWAIKQTVKAIANNPELIIKDENVMSAVYAMRDNAAERGKTVHSMVEVLKNGNELNIESMPEYLKGYARALVSWWKTSKPQILVLEKEVVSKQFGFAGTADCICKINGTTYLLDFKTGKDIYDEAELQLVAYRQALLEQGDVCDKMGIVLLKENGEFKFEERLGDIEDFLNVLKVWHWKNDKEG
jgi:hypothetical protein